MPQKTTGDLYSALVNPVNSRTQHNLPKASIVGFAAFFVAAGLLGETWPVSQLPMYSSAHTRSEGALPTFTVDGEVVEVADYEGFAGGPLDELLPNDQCRSCELIEGDECREFASSLGYIVHRDLDWMKTHSGDPNESGVTAVYGYRPIRVVDGAMQIGKLAPTWCGTARPR